MSIRLMLCKFVILKNMETVIALIPATLLFIFCILSFFREAKLERQRFLKNDRLADEHVLREVERFLKECRCEDQKEL